MDGDANGNTTLSSYDIIDRILTLLSRRDVFPNLRHVDLAGHSAGGVFVHLYSITNQVHEKLPFALSYVVSNPSPARWPYDRERIYADQKYETDRD